MESWDREKLLKLVSVVEGKGEVAKAVVCRVRDQVRLGTARITPENLQPIYAHIQAADDLCASVRGALAIQQVLEVANKSGPNEALPDGKTRRRRRSK
jgi:hypothetical protein